LKFFTLASRLTAAPQTVLTNFKLSTNAAATVTLGLDPDLPLIAGLGLFLFDGHATPHFPYGADVFPDV
jgi:hypothetical protein